MATIAFCIFNYQGELNSTLKLAKKLSLLGHEVLYLGLPDYEEKVCSYGFKFLPILERWFPKGFIQQLEINNSNSNKGKDSGNRVLTKGTVEVEYHKYEPKPASRSRERKFGPVIERRTG
ncbi:hypothetical protein IQ275_20645, partial [Nostoc sp. LEGE 12450]|nr:hypothetical protein [Nostoc sp. LEGE 12450]